MLYNPSFKVVKSSTVEVFPKREFRKTLLKFIVKGIFSRRHFDITYPNSLQIFNLCGSSVNKRISLNLKYCSLQSHRSNNPKQKLIFTNVPNLGSKISRTSNTTNSLSRPPASYTFSPIKIIFVSYDEYM